MTSMILPLKLRKWELLHITGNCLTVFHVQGPMKHARATEE